ncbi:light-harvesting antenna LH1, beta subunit [Roseiflexus sp. RS-1]|jgi:Antenna complex alpha/beta subunit.|uniref:light-harvesting antenna LH1, beta subunit n=1 Tax=Roseiflexus sp. (strain RS-1) TaxID=357808 RepID=UPI0000D813F7|nr:light-harvesting antenna LH1, beta subunit [Roseiflexus sp. RS-1]ABQ91631.1 antenna complex, alpha/beta subunit [Roseiflexus sp. RS-1]MBO9321334.1 light-harvesting protein [Roseiflexus sp.]
MSDKPQNDLVPDQWKPLFNNAEWLVHDIVVKTIYGGLVIAVIAHILCWAWTPWLRF